MKTAQLLRMAIVLSVWTTSSGNFVDFLDSVEDKIRQFTSAKPNKIVQDVKNIFMGLPFEVGFQAIDAYCEPFWTFLLFVVTFLPSTQCVPVFFPQFSANCFVPR